MLRGWSSYAFLFRLFGQDQVKHFTKPHSVFPPNRHTHLVLRGKCWHIHLFGPPVHSSFISCSIILYIAFRVLHSLTFIVSCIFNVVCCILFVVCCFLHFTFCIFMFLFDTQMYELISIITSSFFFVVVVVFDVFFWAVFPFFRIQVN